MIEFANQYITAHGLKFNPHKTKCISLGKCKLREKPPLTLNGVVLEQYDKINYLGAVLSNDVNGHVQSRIQACRRAFYSLQGAGLCVGGASPQVISQIWNMVLRPILMYGVQCFHLNKRSVQELEKTQSKLLKAVQGLRYYCRKNRVVMLYENSQGIY